MLDRKRAVVGRSIGFAFGLIKPGDFARESFDEIVGKKVRIVGMRSKRPSWRHGRVGACRRRVSLMMMMVMLACIDGWSWMLMPSLIWAQRMTCGCVVVGEMLIVLRRRIQTLRWPLWRVVAC